jgi:hypothetical protein
MIPTVWKDLEALKESLFQIQTKPFIDLKLYLLNTVCLNTVCRKDMRGFSKVWVALKGFEFAYKATNNPKTQCCARQDYS